MADQTQSDWASLLWFHRFHLLLLKLLSQQYRSQALCNLHALMQAQVLLHWGVLRTPSRTAWLLSR
jgi:hypothetical protein